MNKEEIFRKYLDGELTAGEEREALHMIADDPQMRAMLHFERKLGKATPEIETAAAYNVPEGFSDRVMKAIETPASTTESTGLVETAKNWIESIWTPRELYWRPAYGLAVAVVLLVSVLLPFYVFQESQQQPEGNRISESIQTVSDAADQVWLRFVYIDNEADSIAVAGDFSNWDPISLTKQVVNGEQVWTGLVSMTRGEHRYMFVKDGEKWITDPLASVQREDGFGNKNAVIYL